MSAATERLIIGDNGVLAYVGQLEGFADCVGRIDLRSKGTTRRLRLTRSQAEEMVEALDALLAADAVGSVGQEARA